MGYQRQTNIFILNFTQNFINSLWYRLTKNRSGDVCRG